MLRKSVLFVVIWVGLSTTVFTSSAMADLMAPADLNPGDTFHWAFVTSTTIDSASSDIDVYNTFVNTAAGLSTQAIVNVQGVTALGDITWKAIGSTSAVDAKDNIGDIADPIYNTVNQLVADNEADLFDGTLYNPVHYDESGVTADGWQVHTGTDRYGSAYYDTLFSTGHALGDPGGGAYGNHGSIGAQWIATGQNGEGYLPLYAISEPLTVSGAVVPLPGAVILGLAGMGVAGVRLRKYA